MLYFVSNAKHPLQFVSSGNLINDRGFLHEKRNLDSFVLILVQRGMLHINQCEKQYDVDSNQYIILMPNQTHYGYKKSKNYLSYYWTHFYIKDNNYKFLSSINLKEYFPSNHEESPGISNLEDIYFVPIYGKLSQDNKANLLFNQLLDISRSYNFKPISSCHYALSLLMLEITNEFLLAYRYSNQKIPPRITEVIEWIRINYRMSLTIEKIAENFNYNPIYLSSLFKKYTGYPLHNYLIRFRINVSKNLLINKAMIIDDVAQLCGFNDPKNYMKCFKKIEGITPTQYRETFYKRKINKN